MQKRIISQVADDTLLDAPIEICQYHVPGMPVPCTSVLDAFKTITHFLEMYWMYEM